jgi:predicted enzyme related to lactoylglutathione lyase
MRQWLINLDVPDLDAAVAFYTAAFDLRLSRRLFDGGVAELVGGPAPLYLIAATSGSVAAGTQARDYARHWTPLHLDIVVDDIHAAVARAVAAGATLERAPREADWGVLAVLADPFGHGFCFVEWRAGYDAVTSFDQGTAT